MNAFIFLQSHSTPIYVLIGSLTIPNRHLVEVSLSLCFSVCTICFLEILKKNYGCLLVQNVIFCSTIL